MGRKMGASAGCVRLEMAGTDQCTLEQRRFWPRGAQEGPRGNAVSHTALDGPARDPGAGGRSSSGPWGWEARSLVCGLEVDHRILK